MLGDSLKDIFLYWDVTLCAMTASCYACLFVLPMAALVRQLRSAEHSLTGCYTVCCSQNTPSRSFYPWWHCASTRTMLSLHRAVYSLCVMQACSPRTLLTVCDAGVSQICFFNLFLILGLLAICLVQIAHKGKSATTTTDLVSCNTVPVGAQCQ